MARIAIVDLLFRWPPDGGARVDVREIAARLTDGGFIKNPRVGVGVKEFRSKYGRLGKTWIEGEHWFAETRREFTSAEDKVAEFLRGRKSHLHAKGIPSYVAAKVAKRHVLVSGKDV